MIRGKFGMLVYAREFGSYFGGVEWRQPTLVLEQLMTEVYASDFVIDAWIEPSFKPASDNDRAWIVSEIDALRDIILWSVTLAGICRALKRPLVKVSTVKVFDSVGHGRRRGTPVIGSGESVGGMYLQSESLVRQNYPATVIYRAPILYGMALDSPINRVSRATRGESVDKPRYAPEIETHEQVMLAFAGDFVPLLMQQIDVGPLDMPVNLWPYEDSQPLSWYDAAKLAWPDKAGLYSREQGYKKRGSSTFTPDIFGEGTYRDGFRRYREEKEDDLKKKAGVVRRNQIARR